MVNVSFDDESYRVLIGVLQEKYYSTTDLEELSQINKLYKQLYFESETWLSTIHK